MTNSKISARHILVVNEYEANDVSKLLNEGKNFADLAKSFSKCPSATQGGDLGEFAQGRMVEAFNDAAFALKIDEVSKPIRTRFGYHIIQRYK